MYPKRYESEPRKRAAYKTAYDYIAVYGLPRNSFDYHSFGLNRSEMKEIWRNAEMDVAGKSAICVIY